ncbi:MAG: YeeE/YedE family protein [Paracoccaceae bacterium]|nr:YeeE/YedE family protein [Paracoccaceae bacterium]
MNLIPLLDRIGDHGASALLGLLTGMIFGVAAQRSAFCLRAATVEFARGRLGPRVAVWLLTFSTALVWVQGAELAGLFQSSEARIMDVPGSWSGAMIGGLLFGIGMVMARGCSGRLLVLAATGNLRSVVSGLIFAVVAQMSLRGWMAPLRSWLAGLWTTRGGHNLDLLGALGQSHVAGLALGLAVAIVALEIARRNGIGGGRLVFASGVGFAVAVGWVLTYALAQVSFAPVTVTSATFTGPSADTLMFFLSQNSVLGFDVAMVPGVFLGSFLAAAAAGELKFQGFEGESSMRRAMAGAALMGFGGMLAGGCAIGNGVTGASIFTGTSWLALLCMWISAMAADRLIDQRAEARAVA